MEKEEMMEVTTYLNGLIDRFLREVDNDIQTLDTITLDIQWNICHFTYSSYKWIKRVAFSGCVLILILGFSFTLTESTPTFLFFPLMILTSLFAILFLISMERYSRINTLKREILDGLDDIFHEVVVRSKVHRGYCKFCLDELYLVSGGKA